MEAVGATMVGLVLVDYVVAVAVQKCAATSPTDAASVITADLCTYVQKV